MQITSHTEALKIPPFLRLGFRPFFFLGALLALLVIPLWIAAFTGKISGIQPMGGWMAWHRHELIFGFAAVIIAGFLLTAVQTWTGVRSLSGNRLLALTILWCAARIAWFLPIPTLVVVVIDALFLPLVALQMAYCVGKVKQLRNYPIVLVLLVLAALNIMLMCGVMHNNDALERQAALGAVWAIAALMGLIGGRVIPFFTFRGIPLDDAIPAWEWLDNSLLIGSLLAALAYATGFALQAQLIVGVLFLLLGLGHLIRFVRWYRNAIWRVPLLWSLFMAYAWFVVAYFATGLWHLGVISNASAALHALTVGAMSGLILAMISRVTLGHTGRKLIPPKPMTWVFALFNLGAFSRVFGIQFDYILSLWLAVACWSLSFVIYLYFYGPMLCKARVDGAPG